MFQMGHKMLAFSRCDATSSQEQAAIVERLHANLTIVLEASHQPELQTVHLHVDTSEKL